MRLVSTAVSSPPQPSSAPSRPSSFSAVSSPASWRGEPALRGADLDSPVAKRADLVRPREEVLVGTKRRKLGPGALHLLSERGDRGPSLGLGALGGSELRARVLG